MKLRYLFLLFIFVTCTQAVEETPDPVSEQPTSVPQVEPSATTESPTSQPQPTPSPPTIIPPLPSNTPTETPTSMDNKSPLGWSCVCDQDCATIGDHQGLCVQGICAVQPTNASPVPLNECLQEGTSTGCPDNSLCKNTTIVESDNLTIIVPLCLADCDKNRCFGSCASLDNSCEPNNFNKTCDSTCSEFCIQDTDPIDIPTEEPIDIPTEEPTSDSNTPASACTCDADCPDVGNNTAICLQGICMTKPVFTGTAQYCEEPGSTVECAEGFGCWNIGLGDPIFFIAPICFPDCDAFSCDGTCDADNSCIWESDEPTCDNTCSEYCNIPPPGSLCTCDDDCTTTGSHRGVCIAGICMAESLEIEGVDETELEAGGCLIADRTEGCYEGSRCWGGVCFPDCDSFDCAGVCDSDDSCIPSADATLLCDNTCSLFCL